MSKIACVSCFLILAFLPANAIAATDMPETAPAMHASEVKPASDYSTLGAGMRMVVSLLVVLALITGGAVLLKKRGLISNEKHPILVLSKLSLGQKKSICLVKIADEILVIGLTNTNISLLSKMNADDYYRQGGIDIHEAQAYAQAGYKQSLRKLLDRIRVSGKCFHKTSNTP